MEDRELRETLRQIQDNQERIGEKVDHINGSVTAIMLEIGGVPDPRFRESDRPSMRHRLHDLENDRAVERAIRNSYDRAWTKTQKTFLFAFSFAGFVFGLLAVFGVGQ